MKKQRESSNNQIGLAEKQNLVACLARMGVTHVEFTMFSNDNSDLISHGFTPSPLSIEDETKQWWDVVHAQPNIYGSSVYGGYLKVIDRNIWCDQEGISGFSKLTTLPVGTAAGAPTAGSSTWLGRNYRYLVNHVGLSRLQTGDMWCPTPEITGPAFSPNFWTNQSGAITYCNENKKLLDSITASLGITMAYTSNPNFADVSSGYWSGYSAQGNRVCYDYYGAHPSGGGIKPEGYVYDLSEIYAGRSLDGYGLSTGGIKQFHMEWGDLSGSIYISPTAVRNGNDFVPASVTIEPWHDALIKYYRAYRDNLIPAKLDGYSYWGGWQDQNTSIVYKTGSGDSSQYFPNSRGQILAAFFIGNGLGRIPVPTRDGTQSDGWGGRGYAY